MYIKRKSFYDTLSIFLKFLISGKIDINESI